MNLKVLEVEGSQDSDMEDSVEFADLNQDRP